MESNINLIEILSYIDPASLKYEEWVRVGMALKEEGCDIDVWKKWSSTDADRYDGTDFNDKWDSFRRHDITGATIVQMAKERGWSPEQKLKVIMTGTDKYRKTFSWEGDVADNTPSFQEPVKWNPVKDLVKYLEVMFDPTDTIGYTMTSTLSSKGKHIPLGKGVYTNNVGQLIDMLNSGEPIEKVFGSYDRDAGAWIRINPLDGQGIEDKNVVSYNNLLVECDNLPIEEQIAKLEQVRIPIKALVYSGGKSVHAIVPVNAMSEREYRFNFNYIKNILHDVGLDIDSANINPSRLSRLPGIMRGNHKQFLIKTNIGMKTFQEWREWSDSVNNGLPDIENLSDVWEDMPPLKPELISGILRQGHKMIISSTSKAGKTFILMELALAIAEGMNWIGHRCMSGRVLYVNMELDRASCLHRFHDIYYKMGLNIGNHVQNIDVWNLRGNGKPLSELAPILISRMRDQNYLAVMLDPLYKLMDGDENSNSDVARMVSQFDKIAEETGAAVVYAHHFAKGNSASKSVIDRAAGAGTFARDPDAILTMTELDWAPEREEDKNVSAWRVMSSLREFPSIDPVDLFFRYPIHEVDYDGYLAECEEYSTENNKRPKVVLKNQRSEINDIISQCEMFESEGKQCFRVSDFKKINDGKINENSITKRLREAGYEPVSRGIWAKSDNE